MKEIVKNLRNPKTVNIVQEIVLRNKSVNLSHFILIYFFYLKYIYFVKINFTIEIKIKPINSGVICSLSAHAQYTCVSTSRSSALFGRQITYYMYLDYAGTLIIISKISIAFIIINVKKINKDNS